jgi:hypothetical protein
MTANTTNENKKSYNVIISPPFCPFYVKNKEPKAKRGFQQQPPEALLVGLGNILNNYILA